MGQVEGDSLGWQPELGSGSMLEIFEAVSPVLDFGTYFGTYFGGGKVKSKMWVVTDK